MAVPTLVSVTEASTITATGATFAPADYAGALADDLLVGFFDTQEEAGTVAASSGEWTEAGQSVMTGAFGFGTGAAVFVREPGTAPAGSYAFTWPSNSFRGAQVAVVRGVSLAWAVGNLVDGDADGGDVLVAGLPAGVADRLALAVVSSYNNTLTADEGAWTLEGNSNSNFSAVYSQAPGTGAVANVDTGANDSSWASAAVAIWEGAPAAPSPPTSVSATAGDAEATVTWSDGSGSDDHDVEYRVNGGAWLTAATDVANGVGTHTQTGLTNGDTIRFRVKAENATGSSAWVETGDVVPAAAVGATPDVLVQTGTVDVASDGQTVTLSTPVANLDNAFVFLANNRHQSAGPDGNGGNQEADDMGVRVRLTALDTITFSRNATGNTRRAQWIVIEYVGPAGGANEFVVRHRGSYAFTSASTQTEALATAPTNPADVVPFIQGITSTDTGNGADNLSGRAWMSNTGNTLNVAAQVDTATTTVDVVAVEFTGSNWSVGHATLEGQTADAADLSLVDGADGLTGSTFDVGDWSNAWIAAWGYAGNSTNEALADNWPRLLPGDGGGGGAATAEVRYIFHANHDGADDDVTVHVLVNTDQTVTRFQNTANAAGQTDVDVTSAGLTDLARAFATGHATSSGTGTAYGRGWRNYYLTSLTNVAHWCHRSGNTVNHEIEIVDWVGLESTPAPSGGAIRLGDLEVTAMYLGDLEVTAAYLGDVQVFP